MQSRDTEIFSEGLTHDFGQKLKISYLFLGKMGIEITFDDHLVKEQAHLDKKILILHCCHTEIFLKELSHDFGQKSELSSLFFFKQNKPRNKVS